MNNKKSIIAFVLSSAMVAGALVADAVSHRHLMKMEAAAQSATATPGAANTTPAVPKPDAGTQADDSATSSNPAQQAPADTPTQAQDAANGNTGPVPQSGKVVQPIVGSQIVSGDDASQPLAASAPAQVVIAAAATPTVTATVALVPRHVLTVPAGSVLTIRLGEELASDTSEVGQTFTATLDRDLTVNGKTVVTAGAPVTGKVAFARPVGPITGEPVLELRLVSVNMNNADVPVVTSIRTFGPKITGKYKVSRFVKGLFKRYEHQEQEVVLDDQSSYSFTLRQPLVVR